MRNARVVTPTSTTQGGDTRVCCRQQRHEAPAASSPPRPALPRLPARSCPRRVSCAASAGQTASLPPAPGQHNTGVPVSARPHFSCSWQTARCRRYFCASGVIAETSRLAEPKSESELGTLRAPRGLGGKLCQAARDAAARLRHSPARSTEPPVRQQRPARGRGWAGSAGWAQPRGI